MSVEFGGPLDEVMKLAFEHFNERLSRAELRDQTLMMALAAVTSALKLGGLLNDGFIDSLKFIEAKMLEKAGDDLTRKDIELIMGTLLHVSGADRPKPTRTSFTVIDGGKE